MKIKLPDSLNSYLHKPIYVGAASIALLVLILLFVFLVRKVRNKGNKKVAPVIPEFEEVFTVDRKLLVTAPYKVGDESEIQEAQLDSLTLTLIVGLREHLTKVFENPSDQHKAMLAIAKDLERAGVVPIAYTQWDQSPINGIAAKAIVNGIARNVLLGPTLAMIRATAKFPDSISEIVETGHANGKSIYILGIDGLAYGVFEISHELQEVLKD
jgi:hypothetical protein